MNQPYSAKVYDEDVIRGNSGIFKCLTPSYVGDFLEIDSWLDDDDVPIQKNDRYGKHMQINILQRRNNRTVCRVLHLSNN